MLRYVCLVLGLGLLVLLPLSIGGCPPGTTTGQDNQGTGTNGSGNEPNDASGGQGNEDENGTTDEDGTANGDEGNPFEDIESLFDFDCGERTVDTAPASVFIETTWAFQTAANPADSNLAKALFGENPNQTFDSGDLATTQLLYEVDAGGTVVAVYTLMELSGEKVYTRTPADEAGYTARFVVDNGCLTQDITSTGDEENPEGLPDEQTGELPPLPENPCGEGQVALGHEGLLTGDESGEHVCLEVTVKDGCVDCWYQEGLWHERLVYTLVYRALGSLDNVEVHPADANGGADPNSPPETVDIADGDSVEQTTTTEITYRTSPSPDELGYTELDTGGIE